MKALAVATGIVFWTLVLGITWLALFAGSDGEEPVAVLQVEPPPEAPAPAPPATPSDGLDFPPGFSITGPERPEAPVAPAEPAPGTSMMPPPGGLDVPALPETPGDSAPLGADTPPAETPPAADAPPDGMPPAAAMPPTGDMTPPEMPPAADTPPPADTPPADVPPADVPPAADAPPLPDRRSERPGTEQSAVDEQTVASASAGASDDADKLSLIAAPVADLVEESEYGPLPKIAADGRRPAEVYARPSSHAATTGMGEPTRVAVLLNGLGLPGAPDDDVLKGLPASISVAYGAYGRDLQDEVTKARAAGHEVLLQIPLEPENYPKEDPGPHTLLTTLPTNENIKRLQWLMSRYTGYVGVTNHMGAKFESTKNALQPVLEELKKRGLIYVDDGTVQASTARQVAGTIGLDYSVVDVQIEAGAVAQGLSDLETEARSQGTAIGVAKARPETVKQLADWAGKLEAKGIVLVPVSAAVRTQRQS